MLLTMVKSTHPPAGKARLTVELGNHTVSESSAVSHNEALKKQGPLSSIHVCAEREQVLKHPPVWMLQVPKGPRNEDGDMLNTIAADLSIIMAFSLYLETDVVFFYHEEDTLCKVLRWNSFQRIGVSFQNVAVRDWTAFNRSVYGYHLHDVARVLLGADRALHFMEYHQICRSLSLEWGHINKAKTSMQRLEDSVTTMPGHHWPACRVCRKKRPQRLMLECDNCDWLVCDPQCIVRGRPRTGVRARAACAICAVIDAHWDEDESDTDDEY